MTRLAIPTAVLSAIGSAVLSAVLAAAPAPALAEPGLCSPPPVTLGSGPYVRRLMQDLVAARSLSPAGGCTTINGKGAYRGHKLEDCIYAVSGRRRIVEKKGKLEAAPESEKAEWKGRVWLLNATAETLARWTEQACSAAEKEVKTCALDICDYVKSQSAAQFPVKGVVIEPDRSADLKGTGGDVSFFFRDGVTVVTARSKQLARSPTVSGRSHPGRELTASELEDVLEEEYTARREIKSFASIGGVSAECYQRMMEKDAKAEKTEPGDPVFEGKRPTIRWLEVSRDTYLEALSKPDEGYEMFRILARVLKRKSETGADFELVCR